GGDASGARVRARRRGRRGPRRGARREGGAAAAARPRAAGCEEPLAQRERRLQQPAGRRLALVGRPPAEDVVLALPAQHEGDPVDDAGSVLLVGDVVLARPHPADEHAAPRDHLAVQLRRQRSGDAVELPTHLREERRVVTLPQAQPRHRRERRPLGARTDGDGAGSPGHLPGPGRREREALPGHARPFHGRRRSAATAAPAAAAGQHHDKCQNGKRGPFSSRVTGVHSGKCRVGGWIHPVSDAVSERKDERSMTKTKDRVAGIAGGAKPYVDRALHDEELRDHVKQAYAAAREIYDELIGPRGVTGVATRVARDTEVQDNLRTAVDELRQAASRLQGRKEHHGGRNLLLLVGVVAGLLYNPITGPSLRRWAKERLFGGGDEFGYSGEASSSGNDSSG